MPIYDDAGACRTLVMTKFLYVRLWLWACFC